MKLATLKNSSRDGQLLVISQDLQYGISAAAISPNLQAALDNWSQTSIQLQTLYEDLNHKPSLGFNLDYDQLAAPLPRAYQWADGSAYVNHVALVRKARGAELPESFWQDPLIYQGGSDKMLGPRDDILLADTEWGIDFEAEVAIITDDVPMGVSAEQSAKHIQLVTIINDVSLRNLIPQELAKGFGFFQSKPATGFAPVVVTLDELDLHWQENKIHLPLISKLNGELFGSPNAGVDMTFNFAELIHHAAKTRALSAGTIIGSGTVSNNDRSQGSSCIAEKRMLEKLNDGAIKTPFMQFGDTIEIEMLDDKKESIFGKISQTVREYEYV